MKIIELEKIAGEGLTWLDLRTTDFGDGGSLGGVSTSYIKGNRSEFETIVIADGLPEFHEKKWLDSSVEAALKRHEKVSAKIRKVLPKNVPIAVTDHWRGDEEDEDEDL